MNWQDYLQKKRIEYGKDFNTSDLSKQFIPYFESGQRIEVICADDKKNQKRNYWSNYWMETLFSFKNKKKFPVQQIHFIR